ncbi:MAG: ADOP family duplicated permease [Gemmatimonadales bacterium]
MSLRAVLSRLAALRRRQTIDVELAEEIDTHLALAAETKRAAGLDAHDARLAARREFGNPTLARESSSAAWAWPAADSLVADVRFGARMLRKHWAATAVAVGALGIGIGVTSAVVSLLESILHPRYAVADPSRVIVPWAKRIGPEHWDEMQISLPELIAWRKDGTQQSLAAFTWTRSVNVAARSSVERIAATLVTSNFFDLLGARPFIGRGFTVGDGRGDAPNVAVVTYEFWKESMHGDPDLSRPILVDRQPYAVVGVMEPGFRVPILTPAKLLLPVRPTPDFLDRTARSLVPIARLAPGASIASSTKELSRLTANFNADDPAERGAWTVNVTSLQRLGTAHVLSTLGIFLTLAAVVLLVACSNVAILLVARLPARQRELALRLALGAAESRIVRQLFVESALVAAGAAALGVAVAPPVMNVLVRFIAPSLPFLLAPSLDTRTVVAALALAVATCLLFGITPAASAVRLLRRAGSLLGARTSGAIEQEWIRGLLMAVEVALALVLLVGGWLMVDSLVTVNRRQLGFETRQLVTARLLLDTSRYASPAARETFYSTLAARLRAHAELRDVMIGSTLPLATSGELANYATRAPARSGERVDTIVARSNVVLPRYFDALHVPFVAGRMFAGNEREPVVVVNEALAKALWPGRGVIGQRLEVLAPMFADGEAVTSGPRTVVGVVRNIRPSPVYPTEAGPNFWLPYAQQPLRGMYVAVRGPNSATATASLRAETASLDELLPIYGVKSVDELLDYWLADVRLGALIADVLAGVGALLTIVGIYSVVAVFVAQRRQELGVRIALGGRGRDVARHVLGRTLRPTLVGALFGLAIAAAAGRFVSSMLYGVSPLDPTAYAGALAMLLGVVALATVVPARRAARTDPMDALRAET